MPCPKRVLTPALIGYISTLVHFYTRTFLHWALNAGSRRLNNPQLIDFVLYALCGTVDRARLCIRCSEMSLARCYSELGAAVKTGAIRMQVRLLGPIDVVVD